MTDQATQNQQSGPATVDKSSERIRDMFGEISSRYDRMNRLLSGRTDVHWRNITVKTVPIAETAPVLDVCTGTGDLALTYWKQGQGQVPVIGTDFTHNMLRIANQKRDHISKRLPKAAETMQFLEADTLHLPFQSNRFQIVSVAFGLRNVADTRAGLREMIRVCQPGGHVVVLEFSLPDNPALAKLYTWYFENVLPRIGQMFARNQHSAYNYLPASVAEFPYGQQLADLMQDCGLNDVKFKPLTFGIATLYYGRKERME